MPVTVHQSKYADNGVPQDTLAVSLATLPAVGSLMLVLCIASADTNTDLTCADNQGNTYTQTAAVTAASGSRLLKAWTAPVVTSSGTFTITLDSTGGSANSSYFQTVVFEVSGFAATGYVDQSVAGSQFVNFTPWTHNIADIAVAGSLVAALTQNGGGATVAASAGWTVATGATWQAIYKVAPAAAADDPSWTWSGAGVTMYNISAVIEPAASNAKRLLLLGVG